MRTYNLTEKILRLKAVLLDVDGVLTPGGIWFSDSGDQFKRFDVKDGLGLVALRKTGIIAGIITGKHSELVARRASELRIEDVYQGFPNKMPAFEDFMGKHELEPEQVCFFGDEVIDVPVMRKCGLAVCPADAAPIAKRNSDWVARAPGGAGAIREIVEIILAAKSGIYPPDNVFIEWVGKLPFKR